MKYTVKKGETTIEMEVSIEEEAVAYRIDGGEIRYAGGCYSGLRINDGRKILKFFPEEQLLINGKKVKAEGITIDDAIYDAMAAEIEKIKKATIKVYTSGWESHEITINTLLPIEPQIERYAERYSDDCTVDSIREDYEYAIGEKQENAAKKADAEAKREADEAAALAKAKETGEKQAIRQYSDDCDDPNEECDMDIVTVWAMPNGAIKETRQHTW